MSYVLHKTCLCCVIYVLLLVFVLFFFRVIFHYIIQFHILPRKLERLGCLLSEQEMGLIYDADLFPSCGSDVPSVLFIVIL